MTNDEINDTIENIATDIAHMLKIQCPIENIDDIVNKLNGKIQKVSHIEEKGLYKINDEKFIIKMTPYDNNKQRTIQMAMQIGHLFLHMGYLINKDIWKRQHISKPYGYYISHEDAITKEWQAYKFAQALLMPKELYKEQTEKNTENNTTNTKKIAEYFNVTRSAATSRGVTLGIIEPTL